MSKSANNFLHRARDVAEKYGYEPIRYFMLTAGYRMPAELHRRADRAAARTVWSACTPAAITWTLPLSMPTARTPPWPLSAKKPATKFKTAMDDDLNTPDALAAIFDLVKDINTLSDASDKATLETAAKTFDELTGVLGLLYNRKKTDAIPAEVTALVEERAAAKKAKDWGRADAIRAQLTEMGWSVTDTAQGPKIAKL